MSLTRPKIAQLNTTSSVFEDPIIVLSGKNTSADLGIVMDAPGKSNVALLWRDAANSFVCGQLTPQIGNGKWEGALAVSGYANFTANTFYGNFSGEDLTLKTVSSTTTPSSGNIKVFGGTRAGKPLINSLDCLGTHAILQPSFFDNSIMMWLPGTSTTLAVNLGTSFTARNSGTSAAQSHPALSSTNIMTQMTRANFGTGTTTTGASGIQTTGTVAWLGNSANRGGFFFAARFGIETYLNTIRTFIGLSANNAAMTAEPSTWANTIGLGKDSTDTTWQIIARNGSSVTKTNIGLAVTAGQVLDLNIYAPPNSSTVYVTLLDVGTGTVYVDNAAITTNIPVNTTFLYMQAHIQATTGTTAKVLALSKMYLEKNI
jgi:hypothetical protein